ncbi:MAG TPA: hypothetical protein ENI79_03235, partial [Rhodospirillales bacterium]|nr:hypothetical protein [Rhodospirillales bacterium]
MNKKTLILFLIFFAFGAAVSYVIGALLSGGEAEKSVETSSQGQPARPGWKAAAGSGKPLQRQDQAKAASKKDAAERQRILKVG